MTPTEIEPLLRHALACRERWEPRFANVGAVDGWGAYLRDAADLAGWPLAERTNAAGLVLATLLIDTVSVGLMRQHPDRWTPAKRDTATVPLQITAALTAPYLEGGA